MAEHRTGGSETSNKLLAVAVSAALGALAYTAFTESRTDEPVPGKPQTEVIAPEHPLSAAHPCFDAFRAQAKELDDRRLDGKTFKAMVREPKVDDPNTLYDGVRVHDVDNAASVVWNPVVAMCKGKEHLYMGIMPSQGSLLMGGVIDAAFSRLEGESELKEVTLRFDTDSNRGYVDQDGTTYGVFEAVPGHTDPGIEAAPDVAQS